jgi:hypothetical protein
MFNNPSFEIFYDVTQSVAPHALNVLRMLRPHKLANTSKVRLGRFNDGGYVMADLFAGTEAAYSLGINDDVSWDMDVAAMGIPVYQYDHTIDRLPESHPLFHWEKKGISGIRDENPEFATLEDLVQKNGHEHTGDLLLKCDIEGAEWLLLARTPNRVLRQFRQIVIEVHQLEWLGQSGHADNLRQAITNLTSHHSVIHVHANNYAPWMCLGGVPVPNSLELTLVRDDVGSMTFSDETFPTALDMPCNPLSADLYLGRFAY